MNVRDLGHAVGRASLCLVGSEKHAAGKNLENSRDSSSSASRDPAEADLTLDGKRQEGWKVRPWGFPTLGRCFGVSGDYFKNPSTEEVATARAEHLALVQMLEEVGALSGEDRAAVKKLLDALPIEKTYPTPCCQIKGPKRMNNQVLQEQMLREKIRALPLERVAEVEDFRDFLSQRDSERRLVKSAAKLSEDALQKVWDNPEGADDDRL